jgi:hypothetical protein
MDSGWAWFGVAALAVVAAALFWKLSLRRTHLVGQDQSRPMYGNRPFSGADVATPHDSAPPRPPLTQSDDRLSEDDMQQEKLGPRGVPGEKFPFAMTPERRKKTPVGNDPGHTA